MSTLDLIRRHAKPVPRYTSYPTAPHFHDGVTSETYRDWLDRLTGAATLSLYVHIPFCDTLCWFCGCQTKQIKRYVPVREYLPALFAEIGAIGEAVGTSRRVTHVHWGGGSPTILRPDDIKRLAGKLAGKFAIDHETDFAIEVDPRDFDAAQARALHESGLTRASIGVQDFSEKVQAAINRHQSYEETRAAFDLLNESGVRSINVDMVYGLPYQSQDDLAHTIDRVITLQPNRVAVFGYAHVPWMKPHQRLIPDDSLADPAERFGQMEFAAKQLSAAGYVQIGIDHFARPDDSLAQAKEAGAVKRNFQGYTTDDAEALLGLGASSISRLPQGYAQNEKATGRYMAAVEDTGFAVVKGIALSDDDRMRGWFIERLLSDFEVSRAELSDRFGAAGVGLAAEADSLAASGEGLLAIRADTYRITDTARPFARTVAARFDAYLGAGAARHSIAV